MSRRAWRRVGAASLLLVAAFGLWTGGAPEHAPGPIEAAAFRMLPWSRLAAPAASDGTWRVPLRSAPLGVRVLSRSCGCLAASIERRGASRVLVMRLAPGRRPPAIRIRLAFSGPGEARALRSLLLEPRYPPAPRACVPLPVHVAGGASPRGHAFAHVHLEARRPPRLVGDPRLGLVAWPAVAGGWRVLVRGFVPPGLAEPGCVVVDGVDIPLRAFRRIR